MTPEINNRAAFNAMRKGLFFEASTLFVTCRLYCKCGFDTADTLSAYYDRFPFQCPNCHPNSENLKRYGSLARNMDARQRGEEVSRRLTQYAFTMDKAECGPVFGLAKRIKKHGLREEDRRKAWDILRPEESLIDG